MKNKLIDKITSPVGGRLNTFVNLYTYGLLRKTLNIEKEFDAIHMDGYLMCWYLRLLGWNIPRRSFDMTSVGRVVFDKAAANGSTVLLIGGEDGVADKAARILQMEFQNIKIVKTFPGFFKGVEERLLVIKSVVELSPNIVVVGMGGGKQEEMLMDLKKNGFSGEGYTCGGFLHQVAMGKADYFPDVVNRFGMRWLYRCYKEPKVIIRLLKNYPVNTVLFFIDYIAWRLTR